MTIEDKYVIVVFGEEGSKETFRVTINSTENLESIIKQYTFTLKQYISKEGNTKPGPINSHPMPLPSSGSNNSRPPCQTNDSVQQTYPPKNLLSSNPSGMSNPFGQE
jgi:hypothetical protein